MKRSLRNPALKQVKRAFAAARLSHEYKTNDVIAVADETEHIASRGRRKFISDAAKAAMLTGMVGAYGSCNTKSKATQPVIAIVGAGMAGLHAAFVLKQAGYTSTLYEATQRSGGRIFTVPDMMGAGLWTEMGGEFIDTNHVDMHNLCRHFNLPLIDRSAASEQALKEYAYYFEGKHLQKEDILKALHPFAEQMAKDVDSLSEEVTFEKHTADDLRLDQLSIPGYLDSIGVKGWFKKFLETAYTTEYGSEAAEQSALNMLTIFDAGNDKHYSLFGESDELYSVEGGNNKLCDALAKELQSQIQLDHFLTAISRKTSKYALTFKNNSGTSKDIEADLVILALPFTLLRTVDMQLELPQWKTNAIRKLGYGMNSKLFIGVNERVWRKQGYAGYAFTDNVVMNGYDHTQMQHNNEGAGGYTINLGGKQSIDCGNIAMDKLQQQYLPALDAIFPGVSQSFSNRFQRWHWPSFPFSKCSYTSFAPGQYTTISGATIKPVDNLFFAGEHCSYAFQGFMNGAAQTGREAAEAIIAILKKPA